MIGRAHVSTGKPIQLTEVTKQQAFSNIDSFNTNPPNFKKKPAKLSFYGTVDGYTYTDPFDPRQQAQFFITAQMQAAQVGIAINPEAAAQFYGTTATIQMRMIQMMMEREAAAPTIQVDIPEQKVILPQASTHEQDNEAAKIIAMQKQRDLKEQKRLLEAQQHKPSESLNNLQTTRRQTG